MTNKCLCLDILKMKSNLICILFFVVCVFPINTFAQIGVKNEKNNSSFFFGKIIDNQSEEPLPFVSISFKKSKRGIITDSAGNFNLPKSSYNVDDTIFIQSVGYINLSISCIQLIQDDLGTIRLVVQASTTEAVVKSKYNRALWFWKKIMAQKVKNNPVELSNYSYELYNKLEVDLNNVRKDKLSKNFLVKPLSFVFNYIDSSEKGQAFLPVYLTETISDYYYQNKPNKSLELIKKNRTNGIENESILKELGGTYQNINVYKNVIPVFNINFISPFHYNADAYYQFKLADTAYLNGKRLIHFLFKPKGKNELTFDGDCWVNDTSFAIQKITLRPSTFADINFLESLSMIQEYKIIKDSIWFLAKDRFVVDFSPVKGKLGIKGRKTTTYINVKINDSSVSNRLMGIVKSPQVDLLPNNNSEEEAEWQKLRHEPLSKTEKQVYALLDTLNKNKTYLFYQQTAMLIIKGTKDFGNFTLGPWFNLISGNRWEGSRFRLDLSTNTGFSNHWNIYGYGAYGFKDKKTKGMFGVTYRFAKSPLVYVNIERKSDLEFGQKYFDQINNDNLFGTLLRRPNIPFKFQKLTQNRISFFHENNKGFQFTWSVADKQYEPLLNLPNIVDVNNENLMHSFEVGLEARFAYQERYLENNFSRFGFGSTYPVVDIKYVQSFKNIMKSSNNFKKLNMTINDELPITPFGYILYSIYAGKTWGKAAYSFLDIMPGNEMMYYNKYSFNMMRQYEFISDAYAGMNIEHNIGKGFLKYIPIIKKTKWRQFWSVKALVGGLSDENKQLNFVGNHPFHSLQSKTYSELGTGIDNIAKFFRLDLVWRLKSNQLATSSPSSFGIFGSFRVSF